MTARLLNGFAAGRELWAAARGAKPNLAYSVYFYLDQHVDLAGIVMVVIVICYIKLIICLVFKDSAYSKILMSTLVAPAYSANLKMCFMSHMRHMSN